MMQIDIKPPALDLFREVHKGLRRALFHLCEAAGALDRSDLEARRVFAARFAEIDGLLTQHHGHEDGGAMADLIEQSAPQCVQELQAGHETATEHLVALRSVVTAFTHGHDIGDELYDRITLFVADYLGHMAFEEGQVMPALAARTTFEELVAVEIGIRSAITPVNMVVFMRWMLPAMTPDERLNMLGQMQLGAPPDDFDSFWATAAHVLTKDQLAFVAGRLGEANRR
jgi:hemerythrin-like domain-containing protein